ncbi:MAG: hypothetical protein EXR97_05720 [Nitrospiraceae bacterium]|nr:hypothetical protein [Nitrospiraceae bacterium]MSR23691.1 hypothetical protein [Nitrospiraceae bacterium]
MRTLLISVHPARAAWLALALCVTLGAAACGIGGPPPPVDGPFDGIWTSAHLGYDFMIDGSQGKAISSSRATIHKDDQVFHMMALDDDMRFSGKQLLSDGTWHEFVGELKADGKIYCNDGTSSWILERKSQ